MRFLLLFFLLVSFAYANHIHWRANYAKALQEAIDENKTLMVLLVKHNSKKCNIIIRDVFMDKPYIDKLNKKVIAVIVTQDHKINYPFELFYSNTFPTLFFVNHKEIFVTSPITNITSQKIEDITTKLSNF